MPVLSVTPSGLEPRRWIEKLLWMKRRTRTYKGPTFSQNNGEVARAVDYESLVFEALEAIQVRRPDLIEAEINVTETFGVSRSFCRGATTAAKNGGASSAVIDMNNRWSTVEAAKGTKPTFRMRDLYTDVKQALPTLLAFLKAL